MKGAAEIRSYALSFFSLNVFWHWRGACCLGHEYAFYAGCGFSSVGFFRSYSSLFGVGRCVLVLVLVLELCVGVAVRGRVVLGGGDVLLCCLCPGLVVRGWV